VVGIHGTGNDQGKVCTADTHARRTPPVRAPSTSDSGTPSRRPRSQTCFTTGSEIDLFRPCCTLPKPAA
jgi:hypothetical protein